ncbi:phosphotransferase family protein [Mangrovivirga sp. M17]|uniref:Phosphotransferase family protein n=1 Tax=Mangrovivirga halotolerans TaxID=2993936 RepID=A0ABT3RN96_9BACT|nr:phosphotransferase family protein [Mangrovivirga halotolerans]MCX2743071.1 phosphotransferase family protein [Mangrovivirga halotolerans]
MNDSIDQPTSLKSDKVSFDNLQKYLKDALDISGTVEVKQFPSGFSNLTYLIKTEEKEYVLRRPPVGANIKSAHDMSREYKVLSLLKPVYDKIPDPIAYCDDENIIGASFYLMERVKGIILRQKPPKGVVLNAELMKELSTKTVDLLAELHSIPLEGELKNFGKPEGYVRRQVEGWIKRYYKAETDKLERIDEIVKWLENNMPGDLPGTFIHNDFKYDNLVLNPDDLTNVLAVLDWEMATVGNPLMDLGTTLGYWTEINDPDAMKYNLTWLPGNLNRQEFAERYSERADQSIENILFYYVFGLFKIGVIVQQIYKRYTLGHTKDERFAALPYVLKGCTDMATRAINKNKISNLY